MTSDEHQREGGVEGSPDEEPNGIGKVIVLNQQIQQTINVYGIQPSSVPPEPEKPVIERNLSISSADKSSLPN